MEQGRTILGETLLLLPEEQHCRSACSEVDTVGSPRAPEALAGRQFSYPYTRSEPKRPVFTTLSRAGPCCPVLPL